jgi:phytoene synthase
MPVPSSPFEILLDAQPLVRRLALSYAPRETREPMLALLALDLRLAGIVRSSHEPMLAQLRLAWWREQLASDGAAWPAGEPLLVALRSWGGEHRALLPLADGWEGMTGPAPLPAAAFARLADARAAAFAALGGEAALRPARNWALADIAAHLGNAEERATVLALTQAQDWRTPRLPRRLRPLAVLHALAARGLRRGLDSDRMTPGDLAAAMRVGLLGI